ncbi:DNRLRE domain-containing protein [Neorhodopirellula pilleata]|uniref:FecR protein n=1 Tax=Neorhodopirellula pilleata TaxID=2714738 RepID=A0A5C6AVN2_9BACT|nr:DNRLRE domain-containing protein [Neorhodopirellula pilleata]TWU04085.1 FecR protein [Neorhodopirellula pilleata]
MNEQESWARYRELRDKVLDQRADDAEVAELERWILADDTIKRDYVEYMHQESALNLQADRVPGRVHTSFFLESDSRMSRAPQRLRSRWYYPVLAASFLLAFATAFTLYLQRAGHFVATMGLTENCHWGASDMPTMEGASLTRGQLTLVSGIAVLKFPLVDVTLEGPASVDLVSSERCLVRLGRVFAKVHPGGEGFVIETPTATLTDRGTVFGVNVTSEGTSDINVIEGLVDAKHLATGKMVAVTTQSPLRMSRSTIESMDHFADATPFESETIAKSDSLRLMQISTAVGNGRDAYVIAGKERPNTGNVGVILVKESLVQEGVWRRRAYLHFDLSLLPPGSNIRTAKLQLQGAASGIGYLAMTPTTTVAVYGLTDESAEIWDEDTIDWNESPGLFADHSQLDPAKTRLLGKFDISSSAVTDTFEIKGETLLNFLLDDTNGGVTLVIVSETIGEGESYVHGFASKRHPTLAPPVLRLGVSVDAPLLIPPR